MTIRTGVYIGFRLTSEEKIFQWKLIRPCVFYLTYASDMLIVFGVLYFIWNSTELKSKYNRSFSQGVFPEVAGNHVVTVDGDLNDS